MPCCATDSWHLPTPPRRAGHPARPTHARQPSFPLARCDAGARGLCAPRRRRLPVPGGEPRPRAAHRHPGHSPVYGHGAGRRHDGAPAR
eukprot:263525-Chlamydomonas_euryale.AAC.1